MYFNSSGSHAVQAATVTSGTLAMGALTFAHTALLIFALVFAAFVVFRLVRRTQIATGHRGSSGQRHRRIRGQQR